MMRQASYHLDSLRRPIVLETILEVANCRNWNVLAIHVRTTHVHIVVPRLINPKR
jgi:hypothetical protein